MGWLGWDGLCFAWLGWLRLAGCSSWAGLVGQVAVAWLDWLVCAGLGFLSWGP